MVALTEKGQSSVLGALTADAACLGLHWLYDVDRVRSVIQACGRAEFLDPNPSHYQGASGYFAHSTKRAGDLSHYGEGALVMLRSLTSGNAADQGFPVRRYESAFRNHFGRGGEFHGYIDNATRRTLQNLEARDRRALDAATAVATSLSVEDREALADRVLPYTRQFTGDALLETIERAFDDRREVARAMALAIDHTSQPCGAEDDQAGATAKLPALVARYAGQEDLPIHVEAAVRVTHDHPDAVGYARVVARLMEAAVLGSDLVQCLSTAVAAATPDQRSLLERASHSSPEDPVAVVKTLGQACSVTKTVPTIFYILARWPRFTDAIRINLRVGGDSCGRAIVLGAVLGAVHGIGRPAGIPASWLLRVPRNREAAECSEKLDCEPIRGGPMTGGP